MSRGPLASPSAELGLSTVLYNIPRVWQDAYHHTLYSSNLAGGGKDDSSSFESDPLSPDDNISTSTYDTTFAASANNTITFVAGEMPHTHLQFLLIVLFGGFFSFITIVGNLMVMISFKMDKQLQTISNYFLLSLAIADFSIGIISMPLFTYYTLFNYWHLGPFICDTWLAWDYLTSNASVLNLLIISFDRYFSVTRPLTYRARRTTRRAAIMIASAWLISLLLWPPWIYAWPYIEGKRSVKEGDCYIQFLETNIYITFGTALAAFYVPVCIMCILYWRIWRETEKRQRDLTHLQAGKKPPPPSTGSKRSTSSRDDDADFRKNSSLYVETCKYLPTSSADPNGPGSMCRVQTPPPPSRSTAASRELRPRQRFKKMLLSWCKTNPNAHHQPNDIDRDDDSGSSHGSPSAQTPASAETPVRTDVQFKPLSQSIRKQATERGAAAIMPAGSTKASSGDSTAGTNTLNSCRGKSASTSARSFSSDSVYTILIRLPTQNSVDVDGEASQPSIRMILEEEPLVVRQNLSSLTTTTTTGHHHHQQQQQHLHQPHPQAKTMMASTTGTTTITTRERLALNNRLVTTGTTKKAPKKKRKHQERKQERKAAKTLSAILLAFIVTWTPYNVLVLIKTLSPCGGDENCIPQGLWNFAYCLCYINSTVNPLCYALCNANFRRTYIRILSCKWHTSKQRNRGYFN